MEGIRIYGYQVHVVPGRLAIHTDLLRERFHKVNWSLGQPQAIGLFPVGLFDEKPLCQQY